jgi:hypothetical protein
MVYVINVNIFINKLGQALDTSTKCEFRIAFFMDGGSTFECDHAYACRLEWSYKQLHI